MPYIKKLALILTIINIHAISYGSSALLIQQSLPAMQLVMNTAINSIGSIPAKAQYSTLGNRSKLKNSQNDRTYIADQKRSFFGFFGKSKEEALFEKIMKAMEESCDKREADRIILPVKDFNAVEQPHLTKFMQEYPCPENIAYEAGKNWDERKKNHTLYFKGQDINRIVNGLRMKKICATHNLDQLNVANKYLARDYKNYWTVISESVKGTPIKSLSLKQTQQLATLGEKTGYCDWGDGLSNIRMNDNNQITFIDTENKSFGNDMNGIAPEFDCSMIKKPFTLQSNANKFYYMTNLAKLYPYMQPDAQQWYIHRVNELNCPEGLTEHPRIYDNKQYDDPAVDLEKVKKEFKVFKRDNGYNPDNTYDPSKPHDHDTNNKYCYSEDGLYHGWWGRFDIDGFDINGHDKHGNPKKT